MKAVTLVLLCALAGFGLALVQQPVELPVLPSAPVVASALPAAQQPPDEPERHDKYKDDADASCWNPATAGSSAPRRARDPHAHRCECHLVCRIGPNGEVVGDQETNTCELYCTRTHCHCHEGEEPCEMPSEGER